MNRDLSNLKLIIGMVYLVIISVSLYFLFSFVDLKDLTSFEFIKANRDVILQYKSEKFLLLVLIFFLVSIIWVLLLGVATPLLLFSGFVFGKWWGIILALIPTTIGATLLYFLANLFFKDLVERKLAPKFLKLKELFNKNDILYFTFFRFIGGGGAPYPIQNIIPTLFNMPLKNYAIATFLGSAPSMFITVALGSGIENVIDQNEKLSIFNVITSQEIYLPVFGFVIILLIAFVIKKLYFK